MRSKFRILIVDDEPGIQWLLKEILEKQYEVEGVGSSEDALTKISKAGAHLPDILITDVKMPKMDGLTLMKKVFEFCPDIPVIMITGHGDTSVAIQALRGGAFDFLEKPFSKNELLASVGRAVAHCLLKQVDQALFRQYRALVGTAKAESEPVAFNDSALVAVGASYGGPAAITEFLIGFGEHVPPMVIAQHFPAGYSADFAARLSKICRFPVLEAKGGETLKAGTTWIAPSGKQTRILKRGSDLVLWVSAEASTETFKPSVDILFESVAEAAGSRAIGVLLTGMGKDGAEGLLRMRQAGAFTVAQDEQSCAIFGMPRAAIEIGAAQEIKPLSEIPLLIMKRLKEFK